MKYHPVLDSVVRSLIIAIVTIGVVVAVVFYIIVDTDSTWKPTIPTAAVLSGIGFLVLFVGGVIVFEARRRQWKQRSCTAEDITTAKKYYELYKSDHRQPVDDVNGYKIHLGGVCKEK